MYIRMQTQNATLDSKYSILDLANPRLAKLRRIKQECAVCPLTFACTLISPRPICEDRRPARHQRPGAALQAACPLHPPALRLRKHRLRYKVHPHHPLAMSRAVRRRLQPLPPAVLLLRPARQARGPEALEPALCGRAGQGQHPLFRHLEAPRGPAAASERVSGILPGAEDLPPDLRQALPRPDDRLRADRRPPGQRVPQRRLDLLRSSQAG